MIAILPLVESVIASVGSVGEDMLVFVFGGDIRGESVVWRWYIYSDWR